MRENRLRFHSNDYSKVQASKISVKVSEQEFTHYPSLLLWTTLEIKLWCQTIRNNSSNERLEPLVMRRQETSREACRLVTEALRQLARVTTYSEEVSKTFCRHQDSQSVRSRNNSLQLLLATLWDRMPLWTEQEPILSNDQFQAPRKSNSFYRQVALHHNSLGNLVLMWRHFSNNASIRLLSR